MEYKTIAINTPYIRLNDLLKWAGEAVTGGQAKTMIQEGAVLIDGEPCFMRGKKIYPGDVITVEDIAIEVTAA